jgi:hypothetical protein
MDSNPARAMDSGMLLMILCSVAEALKYDDIATKESYKMRMNSLIQI